MTDNNSDSIGQDLGRATHEPGLASRPNAGVFGDCYRACLAHVLGAARHDVPHFGAHGRNQNEATQCAREWLAARGLTIFECWADDRTRLATILDAYSRQNPGAPIILHGEAAMKGGEVNHAVVLLNGEISYDPSGAGVCGPAIQVDDAGASWWLEVLVPSPSTVATQPTGEGSQS